jgi:hypothetical protein
MEQWRRNGFTADRVAVMLHEINQLRQKERFESRRFESLGEASEGLRQQERIESRSVSEGLSQPSSGVSVVAKQPSRDAAAALPPSADTTCVVCLSESRNSAFDPCGHMACCLACANALTTCPICRAAVLKVLKLYQS